MTTAATVSPTHREPQLLGQTVVVIGGSSGIGLETARRARAEGANVVLTGRNPDRLQRAALELEALSSAAFDATDFDRLERFFDELPTPVDHVMVTAGGPYYARLTDIDFEQARRNVEQHLWLPLHKEASVATSPTEDLRALIRDWEVWPAGRHMILAALGQPSSLQISALICERQHRGTPVRLYSHGT